jgi:hypothetical protein
MTTRDSGFRNAIDLARVNLDYAELTGTMQDQYRAQMMLIEASRAERMANVDKALPELAEAYRRLYDEQARVASLQANGSFFDGLAEGAREAAREMGTVYDLGKSIFPDLQSGFKGVFKAIITGAEDTEEALANMLDRISDKLIDFALSSLWTSMLPQGGGGGIGGILSIFGGLFGGSGINPASAAAGFPISALPGQYAMGGNFQANRPMIVGERGPELLVPDRSGYIVPNNRLGDDEVQLPALEMRIYTSDPKTRVEAKWRESSGQRRAGAARILSKSQRDV